jgi:hypothetical protein
MKQLGWGALLVFSLLACEETEKEGVCNEGDESCEVGNGKCVVGYDGDCFWGQVCYANEGAPKGKPGTCTDGQFDAEGKLTTVVTFTGLKDGKSWPNHLEGDCFLGCGVPAILPSPLWLGKAPATLLLSVQGPNAEAEQLKVSVRGVEGGNCEKVVGAPEGRQGWECSFPEGWVGDNTTEPLALKLWTGNTQEYPKTYLLSVDTKPLQMSLHGHVFSRPEGEIHEIIVFARKYDANSAPLEEVKYENLLIERSDGETKSVPNLHFRCVLPSLSCHIAIPFEPPYDIFTIIATGVKAKDFAGNEASYAELMTSTRVLPI